MEDQIGILHVDENERVFSKNGSRRKDPSLNVNIKVTYKHAEP